MVVCGSFTVDTSLVSTKYATGIFWARSEVGLSRLPVTEEIAGSNPVGPAIELTPVIWRLPRPDIKSKLSCLCLQPALDWF